MSDVMVWILLIAGLVVALGLVLVWKVRKQGYKHEPDYRGFFWMGLVWMLAGAGFMLFNNYSFNGLFAMGVIFFVMGAANREKWKKKMPISPEAGKWLMVATAAGVAVLALGIAAFLILG